MGKIKLYLTTTDLCTWLLGYIFYFLILIYKFQCIGCQNSIEVIHAKLSGCTVSNKICILFWDLDVLCSKSMDNTWLTSQKQYLFQEAYTFRKRECIKIAHISCQLGWNMGVFHEFQVLLIFYLQSCAVWNIVLYVTRRYCESIVTVTTSGTIKALWDHQWWIWKEYYYHQIWVQQQYSHRIINHCLL